MLLIIVYNSCKAFIIHSRNSGKQRVFYCIHYIYSINHGINTFCSFFNKLTPIYSERNRKQEIVQNYNTNRGCETKTIVEISVHERSHQTKSVLVDMLL